MHLRSAFVALSLLSSSLFFQSYGFEHSNDRRHKLTARQFGRRQDGEVSVEIEAQGVRRPPWHNPRPTSTVIPPSASISEVSSNPSSDVPSATPSDDASITLEPPSPTPSSPVSETLSSTVSAPSTTPTFGIGDGNKYATIHHMVGNTYTYRLVDWMNDLLAMEEAGFDAVALNLGPDCWQRKSVALAYEAAAKLNTKIRLFWSFDMNVFPQAGDVEAALIAEYINDYATNPYTFKYNGLPFVSTFSGDQWGSSFGRSLCGGWDYVRSLVPTNMYFVPGFFFPNGQRIEDVLPCVEGLFHWNSAWSLNDQPVSSDNDIDWTTQLGANKTYMAGISPTFFTHYPENFLNKNWVYRSDNNYAVRWDQVSQIGAPLIQVISWNDFGESHYIGSRPSSVQLQPGSTTWINGNNHLPWARITKPYVQTYKTGAPEQLQTDLIIWEYRTHPADAVATSDQVGRPERAELLKDEIYITAYLSRPAEVRITVGSLSNSFQASAGINHFVQPFEPGFVTVGMWRDGQNVGGTLTGERAIVAQPDIYDYNPVVEQFWHDPVWESCAA